MQKDYARYIKPKVYCKLEMGMGLGNQLWNIAATHGIANTISSPHGILGSENFHGKGFLTLDCPMFDEHKVSEQNLKILREREFFDPYLNFKFNLFDPDLYEPRVCDILIRGLLQDERYLNKSLPFHYSGNHYKFNFHKSLVCNVRGGEYRLFKNFQLRQRYWTININYFQKKYGITKVVAVTDDEGYCEKLGLFDDIISDNIEKCFAAIMSAELIAASNSTFSFFPIKLNNNLKEATLPAYYNRPYNQRRLWASPQNLYGGYTYVDFDDNFMDFDLIKTEVRNQEKHYILRAENYPVKIRKSPLSIIKYIIPESIKPYLKRLIYFLTGR